jgi:hypothetical protein
MTKIAFFILLITLTAGCLNKTSKKNKAVGFKSFEISYTDGWVKSFSLFADSNKIYFLQQKWDTAHFGILPDTICTLLNTAFLKIHADNQIKSRDGNCVDCQILALKITSQSGTTIINQSGDLDSMFRPLITSLQTFIDSAKHQSIRATVWLDTKFIVSPPPPIIETRKRSPASASGQNGR